MFLASSADIVVYGGAAGGGKTWSLLLEPLRHINNPNFSCVIFRRTFPQVTNPGGLWDESQKVYPALGGIGREHTLDWRFPSGATIKFAHLQLEKNKYDWQGAQVPLIEFDELTHFSMGQFFYLLSRNRSTSGVKPYMRAGTNPDAESWVKKLVAPWVDEDHPLFPTPMGQMRWLTIENNEIVFVPEDWRDENGLPGKSITFIPSSVFDNKALLDIDPTYVSNLRALTFVEQQRLLYGSWSVRPEAGKIFNRTWFSVIDVVPVGTYKTIRYWDFAATEAEQKGDDPDWTVGFKLRRYEGGLYVVEDIVRERLAPGPLNTLIKKTAEQDGHQVVVAWEEEGGSSGKRVSHQMREMLDGYVCVAIPSRTDKIDRASGASAAAYAGNIQLLRRPWVDGLLSELHGFPDLPHDDQVDGLSGAFNAFGQMKTPIPQSRAVSREEFERVVMGFDSTPPILTRDLRVFQ